MSNTVNCPHTRDCALFPLFTQKALLRIWQTTYCEGDHTRCVRYQAAVRGDFVPASLLPNGKHLPMLKGTKK